MKKFFKIFILCFILFIFGVKAHAAAFNSIGKAIDNTGLGHDSIISIVVKDMENGDAVFSKRADTYLNPASSLKIFTMAAALDTLGEKYHFETIIYIDKDKNLYLN